jgi:hypothetical protein
MQRLDGKAVCLFGWEGLEKARKVEISFKAYQTLSQPGLA